jgi:hypothetical protein
MKTKLNNLAELTLLLTFTVALISLGMMSWNGSDPEGKIGSVVFFLPAVGIMALTLYLMFHKKSNKVKIHRINRQF